MTIGIRSDIIRCLRPFAITFLIFLGVSQGAGLRAQTLQGRLIDAATKEGIPLGTVVLGGPIKGIGTSCDLDGNFTLSIPREAIRNRRVTLHLSSIGYEARDYVWVQDSPSQLGTIALKEASNELDPVVVRPTKERYRRKNNPAVMLIERAIAVKDSNQLKQFADYSFQEYEKILFSQVGVTKGKKYFGLSASVADVYKDTSTLVGTHTMPLSLREKQTIYAARGGTKLEPVITGRRIHGIEEAIDEGTVTNGIEELIGGDIDVYANNIKLLMTEFPSPMNRHWATSFYKYYIKDTVDYQGAPCFLMHFRPMNPRNVGLMGHVWIDTVQLSLRHVEMEMPRLAGINWVTKMTMGVDFAPMPTPKGEFWLPTKKSLAMIVKPSDLFAQGVEVQVERELHSYRFGPEALRAEYLDPRVLLPEDEREGAMVDRAGTYGIVDRPSPLSLKEQKAVDFRTYIYKHKGFQLVTSLGRLFATGYLPVPFDLQRKERVKLDLGPYETMVGYNAVEGWRFRFGAMTTANLMQHVFLEGYAGYALGDQKWKYYGKLTFTPRKCVYQVSEGPRNNLSLMATREVFNPDEEKSWMFKDDITSFLGSFQNRMRYYGDKYRVEYERDWSSTFSTSVWAEYLRKRGAGDLHFYQYDSHLQPYEIDYVDQAHIGAELSWIFGRARLRTVREGKGLDLTRYRPKLEATVRVYPKGVLGNPTTYALTSASYSQRLQLSIWGRLDAELEAGAVWGDAPQTSLFNPNASSGWVLRNRTFQTLRPLEYVADKYLRFQGTYHMRGLILNRIPLIKHMRLREVLSLHGYWGHISERNRLPREGMPYLPSTSIPMAGRLHLEVGAGIDNIFNLFRVEYFYRLTDPHIPASDRHAVRIRTSVTF
ncbi:MAG: DUF5686 family protein [Porphyromonadaceae bacterium]|nr:DUF5686 family protein [Porphyromonadaceae bacterium]